MKKCRKIAYIPISPQIMLNMLKKGGTLEAKGLPEDCKYVLSQYDFIRDLFLIAVESNSFECIKEGEKIPEIEDITLSYAPLEVNELKEKISKILSILVEIIKIKEKESKKDLKEALKILKDSISSLITTLSHKELLEIKTGLIFNEEYLKSLLNISKRLNKK